ncbi:hypothetical protein WG66_009784 [Moniliophthora roreri]|nr:hypothetical protein WG66_009784 [Moniliophthora roreri]
MFNSSRGTTVHGDAVNIVGRNQYNNGSAHYNERDNRQYINNNHGGTQNNNNGEGSQTNYNGNWPMDNVPIWPFILLAIGIYICSRL